MNVIIIGPQASGKGTQAEFIADTLGVPHISIGDVFRQEVASGSELGKELKSYMDKGELVPKEINNAIVERVLKENSDGFVLDGYPRNERQAQFLDNHVTIDKVFVLEVPDDECIARIGGRRICDNGHNYHLLYNPPKDEKVCDECGLPLHMRADDQPEAIKKRLAIYHGQTEPVIAHYDKQDVVVRIDGNQPIEAVKKDIAAHLA